MKIRVRECVPYIYIYICQYMMLTFGGGGCLEIKFRGGRIIFNNRTLFPKVHRTTQLRHTSGKCRTPIVCTRFQMSAKLNALVYITVYVIFFHPNLRR